MGISAEGGDGGGIGFQQTGKRIHLMGKRREKPLPRPEGSPGRLRSHHAGISRLPAALANEGELLWEESQQEAKEGRGGERLPSLDYLIVPSSSGKFVKVIVVSALCLISCPRLHPPPKTQSLGLHHATEAILNEVTHDVPSSTSSGHFSDLVS